MRHSEGTWNRVALALWGLGLLAAASWVLWPALVGLLWNEDAANTTRYWGADGARRVLDFPGGIAFADWFAAAVIVLGLLLLVLAVSWLIRQLPRTPRAGTLKLEDDVANGTTTMQPSVLEGALKHMAEDDPAVQSAQVALHGSANFPGLLLRITAEPWARLPDLSRSLSERLQQALELSLGVEAEDTAIEFSVARKQQQVAHRGMASSAEPKVGRK
ncbi:hypothetical protein CQ018_06930 [Arthrobacter sp. MYb227]|uniref:hypothetical protein n=1 Tax=Arthrobacter sp. MYb227 TaxID=1848601 RepID=UPI000CFAE68A|nr:hypothetical protein [Arthrobacter sp. MYb227]PQZ95053.1 hypothetical protein CQ018_06930 [Arthrobacter sp. MYb227]